MMDSRLLSYLHPAGNKNIYLHEMDDLIVIGKNDIV